MKPVKFKDLKIGTEFYQTPQATEADKKIKPQKANVRSGFVNCIGTVDKIRSHIQEDTTVWVK